MLADNCRISVTLPSSRSAAAGNCLIRPLIRPLPEDQVRCVRWNIHREDDPVQKEMLGWNGFFAGQMSAGQVCAGVPGRVVSAIRERFVVWTETGEVEAGIGGNLRRGGSAWPGVGDWVALRPNAPVIEQVFERRTLLSRKQPGRALDQQVLAANIDVLFIVSGLDGDYNERRIERYLVVARQSGARPVILLNKADLAVSHGIDVPAVVDRLHGWSGVPVLPVSALADDGVSGVCDL